MGRSRPGRSKDGPCRRWMAMEDKILTEYVTIHGEGQWNYIPEKAGLKKSGRSCRLRWLNYLKPGIKRGNISKKEEDIIIRLHKSLGNRWSIIAGLLPGRTDNEIKNYWYTNISKKIKDDHCEGDTTPTDHESLEGPNLTKEQQGLCDVPQPSPNETDETTSIPSPEEAGEGEMVATQPWGICGVVHEHFETILSPVRILEENYCQFMHDDDWMNFEIWNNLS